MNTQLQLSQVQNLRDEIREKLEARNIENAHLAETVNPLELSVLLREQARRNREIAEELRVFSRVVSLENYRHQRTSS